MIHIKYQFVRLSADLPFRAHVILFYLFFVYVLYSTCPRKYFLQIYFITSVLNFSNIYLSLKLCITIMLGVSPLHSKKLNECHPSVSTKRIREDSLRWGCLFEFYSLLHRSYLGNKKEISQCFHHGPRTNI